MSLLDIRFWLRSMILCVMGTMMAGCELYQLAVDYRYTPSVQAHPVQLLRISGDKDPNLDIQFVVGYETTHNACSRTTNWISGYAEPRRYQISYAVPIMPSQYSVTIALDHFTPGPCHWRPSRITFSVKKGEIPLRISSLQPTLVRFGYRRYPMDRYYPTELPPLEVACFEVNLGDMGGLEFHCLSRGEDQSQIISSDTKELHVLFREVSRITR